MNTSYLDLIQQGGFIMMLLGFCSVVSLAVILERLIHVRENKFLNRSLIGQLMEAIETRRKDEIDEILGKDHFFLAAYLKKLLIEIQERKTLLSHYIENSINNISETLELRLHVLLFIIQLSPLLGILGTVMGLTDAFLSLGDMAGGEKFQYLAQGIGKALGTTIMGLIVALFSMAGHYLIKYKSAKILTAIQKHMEQVSETYLCQYEQENI